MSDWIDRVGRQMESQEQARHHFSQTFPSVVSRAWETLMQTLRRDIEEINAKHKERTGGIAFDVKDSTLAYIAKLERPTYYVTLSVDAPGKFIKIENTVMYDLNRSEEFPDAFLTLELDRSDNLVILDQANKPMRLEDISERILTPILLGRDPYPHG